MQYAPIAPRRAYEKQYRGFRGIDLSTGVTEIEKGRSPYAPNMIADMAGFPEKRPGYKSIVGAPFESRINGIHPFSKSGEFLIVHAGTKLYSGPVAETYVPTEIYSGAANAFSESFVMNEKLYILDGQNILRFDGTTVETIESVAYVPTTTIAAPPEGGGEKYESINLLSGKRINKFLGTSTAKDFFLDAESITSVDKVEKMNGSGGWDDVTAYTVDLAAGKVSFTNAPGVSPVDGEDNVRITFSKVVAGYADMIKKCTIAAFYGIAGDNRIFISGNADYPNRDWQSGLQNPEYFPDDGYSVVGSENSAIMGYIKQYDALVIVKEESDQDATLYVRTAVIADDGAKITYPLKQGLAGVGAVSKRTFGMLSDDPLFLSGKGVFGIESVNVKSDKTTQLRSYYINSALIKEPVLDQAFSASWGRFYCLFLSGKVYVADGQQANSNKTGSHGYEWYHWTGIPAVCARTWGGDLYFGTAGGDLCKFTTYEKYGLMAYSDNGAPYVCRWSTKMDDMDDFMRHKTLLRRGTGILAKPYASTSGKIYFATERETERLVKEFSALDIFDFDRIDFAKFSFTSSNNPRVVAVNKRLRNTQLLQIIVENAEANQGFGVYGIQIRYVYAKDVK
jgi:hypothetical protein